MAVNKKIFEALRGEWDFKRIITTQADAAATQPSSTTTVTAAGKAIFKQLEDSALHYHEKGVLTLAAGKNLDFQREYVYRYLADSISVYFVENGRSDRLFHSLSFTGDQVSDGVLSAKGSHLCGNDRYNVTYKIFDKSSFEITYNVNGPQKNYISKTVFTALKERVKLEAK